MRRLQNRGRKGYFINVEPSGADNMVKPRVQEDGINPPAWGESMYAQQWSNTSVKQQKADGMFVIHAAFSEINAYK